MFLRTTSLRRLITLLAGVIIVGVGGTAIALAATGGGPKPPPKALDRAARDAVNAAPVQGVTARVKFTNHLGDAAGLDAASPILSGASGRLWVARGGRARLELQSSGGDAQVVVDHGRFWVYDAKSNTVYRGALPRSRRGHTHRATEKPVSLADVQTVLSRIARRANLSGAVPGDVAGQPVYTVRVSPKRDGGLVGAGVLAWDAVRGVPLRAAVYAAGNQAPVLELKATDVSYGPVATSAFEFAPPAKAKTVELAPADRRRERRRSRHSKRQRVSGTAAVAKAVPFRLTAPRQLRGRLRQDVKLLDFHGAPAALVTYGHGLGGIAVIEQPARRGPTGGEKASKQDRSVRLPQVSVHGTKAEQLETALGTVLHFTRGKVAYTLVGSVPAADAVAAARALTR